jgi:uncharacterized protein (TIGR02597 family)
MKTYSKPLLLLVSTLVSAASFISTASAQVTTDPVGYVTITAPAGNTTLSAPLVKSDIFVGSTTATADGVGDSVLTFSGTPFVASAYDTATYPTHYVIITTAGSNDGFVVDIASNTTSTVTLADEVVAALGLGAVESIRIREHTTILDLFDGATGMTAFADAVNFYNDDGSSDSYLWSGTGWVDGGFASVDDRPVYPGQGVVYYAAAGASILVSGAVSTSAIQVPVYSGAAVNFVGTVTPSDEVAVGGAVTLGNLGFGSQLTAFAGSVRLFSTDGNLSSPASSTYLWDGTVFRDGAFADASNVVIPTNTAIVVSNPTPVNLTMPAAY